MKDKEIVRRLGRVGEAFFGSFDSLREIQRQSIPVIASGFNTLLCSATASGKTEAVFAPLVYKIQSSKISALNQVKILAIAPTRALVNDLYSRLHNPLFELSWSCGRQTSDYCEKTIKPDLLITTPESFDSMLARNSVRNKGYIVNHLLAYVEAVFIDEAHLFDGSPRGDQIEWLLGRLRILKRFGKDKGWHDSDTLQICAASATLSQPEILAQKFFKKNYKIVSVKGHREMEIFSLKNQEKNWVGLDSLPNISSIYQHIIICSEPNFTSLVTQYIWDVLQKGISEECRKMLVFVPSRSFCDKLSLELSHKLSKKRDIYVGAHHGSLQKNLRVNAEKSFMGKRDAVLVATTTLEVGIDIGDVDITALIEPPDSTSSFLQKIGRSGRRKGSARILAIAKNKIQAHVFSSILHAAHRGKLDIMPRTRLWSVFIQQVASYIFQAGNNGRPYKSFFNLAEQVWPENDNMLTISQILQHLIDTEFVVERNNKLFLGTSLSDSSESYGGSLHHNFSSENQGSQVIDSVTGEVLANAAQTPSEQLQVAFASQKWNIVSKTRGEIVVQKISNDQISEAFKYAARRVPISKSYAEHLRNGLNMGKNDAPIINNISENHLWFHFGGAAYENILSELLPDIKKVSNLSGIVLAGNIDSNTLERSFNNPELIQNTIIRISDRISSSLELGRYYSRLPDDVKKKIIVDLINPEEFLDWISTRNTLAIDKNNELYLVLMSILSQ